MVQQVGTRCLGIASLLPAGHMLVLLLAQLLLPHSVGSSPFLNVLYYPSYHFEFPILHWAVSHTFPMWLPSSAMPSLVDADCSTEGLAKPFFINRFLVIHWELRLLQDSHPQRINEIKACSRNFMGYRVAGVRCRVGSSKTWALGKRRQGLRCVMLTVASRGELMSADLILETKGSHGRILRQGISFGFFLIKDLSIDLVHLG